MNKIHELDCTLRDGGYCNNWDFGFSNIKKIISGLVEADIDIIECGFITNKVQYDKNITRYTNLSQLEEIIPKKHKNKIFVVMLNYGEFDVDCLPLASETSLDGIRVAFHKKDLNGAIETCYKIKKKGYKVFVQPMVSLCYSDEEFLSLIKEANKLSPYAFYIVDSFGMMKKKDLIRLFYEVEHNLNDDIWIGFHSHNNLQLAYSNAQSLVDIQSSRNLIIDSSVMGMGRGAGNLNTELFLDYLNENCNCTYDIKPLLNIIDEVLDFFYKKNYWGYSLPNYLSALHNIHPNYAMYLDEKKTLTVESINDIFSNMSQEKKYEYDRDYIESLYFEHNATGKTFEDHKAEFIDRIKEKEILLIAPGKVSDDEKQYVQNYVSKNNTIVVSINFDCDYVKSEFIFLSNLRRYKELSRECYGKTIVTSNIPSDGMFLQTKYKTLLNDFEYVTDNAGLMAIKFFIELNSKSILLAGFNGYSHDTSENYLQPNMAFVTKNAILDLMNNQMKLVLSEYSKLADIKFLTSSKYLNRE